MKKIIGILMLLVLMVVLSGCNMSMGLEKDDCPFCETEKGGVEE